MNQALFLKYRPQTFEDIVGQESVVRTLRNSLKAGKPVHAYLFAGSRGTGKTSLARLLAKGLNCENLQNGSPCGKCETCQNIAEGNLVDVIEIDAASNRGIDDIRELREKVNFTPNFAKNKVYIIDEVHMLTKDASNALLKTLEEPPEHAYFILATTELHKILDTIISRCQTFIFGRFTIEQLIGRLEKICEAEGFQAEKTALELIARKAEGGLRDAISALDQIASESSGKITAKIVRESLGISSSEMLENFWQAIEKNDAEQGFEILRTVSRNGADLRTFGHDFLGFLREKMFQSLKSREILAKLVPTIEEIEKALLQLKTSPITELPLEIAVVKLTSGKSPSLAGESEVVLNSKTKSQISSEKTQQVKISRDFNSNLTLSQSDRTQAIAKSPNSKTPEEDDFIFDDEKENPAKKENDLNLDIEKESGKNISETKLVGDITAQKIKDQMENIAKKANFPVFIKTSFLTSRPQIQGKTITFCFHSTFHHDQVDKPKIRGVLTQTISEIFGQDFLVECSRGPASTIKKEESLATSDDLEF